jgi:hypothetical protein
MQEQIYKYNVINFQIYFSHMAKKQKAPTLVGGKSL